MVILLSILLVVLLAKPFQKHPSHRPVSRITRQAKVAVSPAANVKIDWPVPRKYPETLRDPMMLSAPKQVKVQTPAALVVKGISYSEDRRFAVIGTQTVQEGDTIEGATITKINRDSVEFERDGKKWTQRVQGDGK
jgi:type II secretory pathway component PulC